jgi:hypothetical protein
MPGRWSNVRLRSFRGTICLRKIGVIEVFPLRSGCSAGSGSVSFLMLEAFVDTEGC